MTRHVCIHGHFYQPPRENPWTGKIERQPSAAPAHDWNERVTDECYAPNAAARLLDGEGKVSARVNNYASMSFNFGPTLLGWMEHARPEVHAAILEADREGQSRFAGHGPALAQVYGHAILPLCNSRDKQTQVIWGIRDFEHRFGRRPEGMWLPETAVDTASLDALSRHGIRFTVLAPSQAAGEIDPRRAHRFRLPAGRHVDLFFYDGALSHGVAFGSLIRDGERLARALARAFGSADGHDDADDGGLVHIATDGETYGHHHKFGDMALARALAELDSARGLELTCYGKFLAAHPPRREVEIHENSSWSCPHRLGRWTRDCGCASEYREGWSQDWRAPLREALDALRDTVAPHYERVAGEFLVDPWEARDAALPLWLEPGAETRRDFLDRHARRTLTAGEEAAVFDLLELQRCMLLMFTSCGWFFEELSRIETVQILRYAARGIELARHRLKVDAAPRFLERLGQAHSNVPDKRDGLRLWREEVLAVTGAR